MSIERFYSNPSLSLASGYDDPDLARRFARPPDPRTAPGPTFPPFLIGACQATIAPPPYGEPSDSPGAGAETEAEAMAESESYCQMNAASANAGFFATASIVVVFFLVSALSAGAWLICKLASVLLAHIRAAGGLG